jgi:hypothetical protein
MAMLLHLDEVEEPGLVDFFSRGDEGRDVGPDRFELFVHDDALFGRGFFRFP